MLLDPERYAVKKIRYRSAFLMCIGALAICLASTGTARAFQTVVTQTKDGVTVKTQQDQLLITACGPSVVHITGGVNAPSPSSEHTPWVVERCVNQPFTFDQGNEVDTLKTENIQIRITLATGRLSFFDKSGNELLSEACQQCSRTYTPLSGPDNSLYRIGEVFSIPDGQALYGLGQHQSGLLNDRGTATVLSQVNTDIAVPFLISTDGYGLIWNTASRSIVDNRFQRLLEFTASAGEGLDFYFLYGPDFDQLIHHYRQLTGPAPLFPEWAYGFFQSKDHYTSQNQLLQIVDQYRAKHIPLDVIVQDWMWWTKWGANTFNAQYPDFAGAVNTIHENHAHVMISIWPKFDPATPIWQQMKEHGYLLLKNDACYDATNPNARDLYWKMLPGTLLAKGVDAFWLDASEPEQPSGLGSILPGQQLFFGQSDLYTNIYPFMHSLGIYRHWRNTTEQKRVFILTRSSFLGQQHNAAAAWSGDVYSNFWALKRQVPAGLDFALSGMPYWTTDIGGYGYPSGNTTDPKYQEVYARWFEYGTFCPLFRTHGHRANNQNELWSYGPVTPILVKFDTLRYRLLPYIYSLAWQVTSQDYTYMRPLVMDWRTDPRTWEIGDQFMFGPALLVNPVTDAGVTSRSVYLPPAAAWYDFWSGKRLSGSQTIQAAAPLGRIPLYVKAGSILPMGPEIEYAGQSSNQPIELRVYRGANGSFTLYEDQGDSYAYEHGAYATIPIHWDDALQTLTIGGRTGGYPGMPEKKIFNLVLVDPFHGAGPQVSQKIDRRIVYSGLEVSVSVRGSTRQ